MAYTQDAVSDGTLTTLLLSIDYFDRPEISVQFDGVPADPSAWAWVGTTDHQINFTPAVPAGVTVTVRRHTAGGTMRHVFSEGAMFRPGMLDENFDQILRISEEGIDGYLGEHIHEIADVTGLPSALATLTSGVASKVSTSEVGVSIATLVGGTVPSSQLPSYVDDVLEYANLAAFPATGTTGKIYVALDTNKTWRWGGSVYTEISASPGSTDSVTEGATNLYFTVARVLSSVLAGISFASSVAVTAADTILVAIGKLQAQASAAVLSIALKANIASPTFTGVVTVGTATVGGGTSTFYADATNTAIRPPGAGGIYFQDAVGTTTWGTFGTSGLGIGTVPSTWQAVIRAVEMPGGAVFGTTGGTYVQMVQNGLFDSTGTWRYVAANFASRYRQLSGQHNWFTAPVGAAIGDPITWTQAMSLTAPGNLLINSVVDDLVNKLQVAGGARVQALDAYGTAASFQTTGGMLMTYSGAGVGVLRAYSSAAGASGVLSFANSAGEMARFDTVGNLGVGAAPSAWHTSFKAIEQQGGVSWASYNGFSASIFSQNAYDNGSGVWTYATTTFATQYAQNDGNTGAHKWFTAPSGTAGTAITWTQAMTLTASGSLLIGTTTDDGVSKLQVSGSARVGAGGTGSTNGYAYLNGSNANDYGAALFFRRNSVTVGIIGTDSTINGGASSDLVLYSNGSNVKVYASGALAYTVSPTGLAVVNQVSCTALATGSPATKTAATYTVLATDTSLILNGSATITLTLPAAATYPGRWLCLKNIAAFTVVSASSNVVPQAGGAAATAIIAATAGKWASLQSDGTNWQIMSSN